MCGLARTLEEKLQRQVGQYRSAVGNGGVGALTSYSSFAMAVVGAGLVRSREQGAVGRLRGVQLQTARSKRRKAGNSRAEAGLFVAVNWRVRSGSGL